MEKFKDIVPELFTPEYKERGEEFLHKLKNTYLLYNFLVNSGIKFNHDIILKAVLFFLYMEFLTNTKINLENFPFNKYMETIYGDCLEFTLLKKPQETKEEMEKYILDLYHEIIF